MRVSLPNLRLQGPLKVPSIFSAVRTRLRIWYDMLVLGVSVGPCPVQPEDGELYKWPAVTPVDELQKLQSNTSFVPPFPLKFVAIQHPGRTTANGLGSMEIGHADH